MASGLDGYLNASILVLPSRKVQKSSSADKFATTMAFNIHEALLSAREYWTPERIASSVPLDDLFTVYGDTGRLVQSHPTGGPAKPHVSNAPTNDPVSREGNTSHAHPPHIHLTSINCVTCYPCRWR